MIFKISLAQYPILFHSNTKDWNSKIENWFIEADRSKSRILVFPEYGSLDLTSIVDPKCQFDLRLQLETIQNLHDLFLNTFIHFSKKYSVYTLAPTFPVLEDSKFFNRAYFISPTGNYNFQDKIHLTRFEESWGISESRSKLKVFDTALGKIGIQICFDIEFPWASSLLATSGAKLILNPSCTEGLTGLNRVHIGARARALENQIFVGISQTVGESPWSHAVDLNNGLAAIYSPSDLFFSETGVEIVGRLNTQGWIHQILDLSKIERVRLEGEVFNYKYTSMYPWQSRSKENLEVASIELK